MKKAIRKAVPEASKIYSEQLLNEINQDRDDHGKKPFDGGRSTKEKVITESKTDSECGVFHKGDHKKCFAYAAQTACDKHGYILDVTVNAGNVHDSVAFDGLYERLKKRFEMRYVVADAGYKTPWICKSVIDDGIIPALPYKRPMGKDGFFRPYEYIYDEYFDCVLCPENQVLSYSTTNRDGYREFKSCPYICENCPSLSKCTTNSTHTKTVLKHTSGLIIWSLLRTTDIRRSFASYTTGAKKQSSVFLLTQKKNTQCGLHIFVAWLVSPTGSGLSLLP